MLTLIFQINKHLLLMSLNWSLLFLLNISSISLRRLITFLV